mmetsp:Transcript_18569/g.28072  ORF Transcript_18569/g.28072 Transcript_18569/m.28072 type:complete len:565 (-) Transcript_18569:74-1768(-)|eukprot:CAMPEP_0178921996 /NCGR_PEP_ID=MMETSP0786-20121207/15888_1 /TAXON_ID=186022 /ORGANISM="Thalassionema frauenfeldii, Strain CCMP 1798" /LENGTH=564 /DNA_ID=CAMNT_0020596271 /DNA_START=89 /DNA_END=1783 /DNA_ORIENTATION=+
MQTSVFCLLQIVGVLVILASNSVVLARKPPRPSTASRASRQRSRSTKRKPTGRAPPASRRQYEEEYDEEKNDNYLSEEAEEYDPIPQPRPKRRSNSSRSPSRPSNRVRPSSPSRRRQEYDQFEEEYYEPSRPSSRRRPPPHRGGRRGEMVTYPQTPAFTRGLSALKNSLPDPDTVKSVAFSSINAARETTSRLSSNIYRDIKGLTSSELEQVMLKATRPDDTPVKGKHVERMVGLTYQMSPQFDLYDAVLRKLWAKMAERDWRTKIKALYILHRFSADGAPEHQAALKARLRELRRIRDPKRKCKYFDKDRLLAGEGITDPEMFPNFIKRYAHYVFLRAQCFGGVFEEISNEPKASRRAPKPITSTALRAEHLNAAQMVLKAGIACLLKEGEECENSAFAVERVAGDLIGLRTAVAVALNRALKSDKLKGADMGLLKKWCEFYSEELLPQTRSMVKKTSAKLDAYGIYLPSRMGVTVSQELLQKGLKGVEDEDSRAEDAEAEVTDEELEAEEEEAENEDEKEEDVIEEKEEEEAADEEEVEEQEDDYEDGELGYDEEYYDEEEY